MVLKTLESTRYGLGKHPVEQIIRTHSHFDHAEMISKISEKYHPALYAHPASSNVNITPLIDRQKIQVGEQTCTVVHVPGHSEDSLCILCEEEQSLFSGDVPMKTHSNDGDLFAQFTSAFELFVASELKAIYPGHDDPITHNVPHLMEESLQNFRHSRIV